MRRCLTVLLIGVLATPCLPDFAGLGGSVPSALADDDDGFRGGRRGFGGFRGLRPAVPSLRLPRPRVPKQKVRNPRPPSAPTQKKVRSPKSPPAPVVAQEAPPEEIVVGAVSAQELLLIVADGFTLVTSAPTTLIGGVIARLRPPAGVNVDTARQRIQQIVPASIVEPNHLYRPVSMPCRNGHCPAFEMVGWMVPPSSCDATVSIGMIDTKVNRAHASLRDQAIEIIDVRSKNERKSSTVHGTAIAALLVGEDGSRTPGLLPNAKLLAVEAFHGDRSGDVADVYKVVRGIDALSERGIRVVNLSFAGPANALLERAVEAAAERNMILVAAVGNQGPRAERAFPAAYEDVLAVTAIDRNRKIYRQAGRGDHVAFAAPGVRLWTASGSSGGYRSGTSYAVPFVSAAFAIALRERPDASIASLTEELAQRSADLGDAGRDSVFGWGLVKAAPCLKQADNGEDASPAAPPLSTAVD